jgi:hypothetical protein
MEKTETRTKEQLEQDMIEVMGGAMIPVQVELFEPFVKFAKEYLAFFGSKDTFEILCMKVIYDGINRLHRDLTEFVKDKDSPHFLDGSEWFEKHSHLGIVSDQPEDEE